MDYFKSVRGPMVPFCLRLRDLQSVAVGGLSDAGAYRRDRDTNEATNHAQAVLGDA